ncbi:MAG: PIN domain-containing protein [Acidobacteriota bacterium]
MKAFLDTSVLVATFYGDHEHHGPSLDVFLRFGKKEACCGAHSLAEVYATLTGMPGKRRVGGDAALLFLRDIRAHLTLVSLNEREYLQMIEEAAAANLAGGAIYDALLGHCALKAKAKTLYTWNTKDFMRLPPDIASRVRQPNQ